ncbi:dephospho-CoA kinase [Sciscionella marina]|uniref:dephospho-CoA kinase n=1 Tax=Sciscionella marina TaxID=508770 RepID=UPI00036E0F58|nr:dephospho-CoA kinase [Sciscionella marina]
MLRVGLTGGIGAGKSTVSARLAEHGAVLIDADAIAREVVARGTEGLDEVVAEFGTRILTEQGDLDRPKLAATVFSDATARARLNGIVHPRVGARTAELIEGAAEDAIVVHDVPLLVENGLAPAYHLVIVVDAPVPLRIERLLASRDMTEQQARERIEAQASEAQRRAVADVWLDNAGSADETLRAVDELWADRLVPFEANQRLGRCAEPETPRIVDYDRRWPEIAERLRARITSAVGDYPVQHIGSTSVPGLGAKDVIDMQLLVPDLDTADRLAGALAGIGLPAREGQWWDNTKPGWDDANPAGGKVLKRFHGSADPGRFTHLHVRVADGPAAECALLFRDWLRADQEETAAYLVRKRELADRHASTGEYAQAKEPWFDRAYERARAWARRTGWVPPES